MERRFDRPIQVDSDRDDGRPLLEVQQRERQVENVRRAAAGHPGNTESRNCAGLDLYVGIDVQLVPRSRQPFADGDSSSYPTQESATGRNSRSQVCIGLKPGTTTRYPKDTEILGLGCDVYTLQRRRPSPPGGDVRT